MMETCSCFFGCSFIVMISGVGDVFWEKQPLKLDVKPHICVKFEPSKRQGPTLCRVFAVSMEAKVKGAYPCYDWFDVSVQSLHNISCSYHGDLCPLPKHPANTGNEGIMNNHYPLIRLGIAPHLQHIPHLSRWSRTAAPEWSTCLILELALPAPFSHTGNLPESLVVSHLSPRFHFFIRLDIVFHWFMFLHHLFV